MTAFIEIDLWVPEANPSRDPDRMLVNVAQIAHVVPDMAEGAEGCTLLLTAPAPQGKIVTTTPYEEVVEAITYLSNYRPGAGGTLQFLDDLLDGEDCDCPECSGNANTGPRPC